MIATESLTKVFGAKTVVDSVSLTVRRGEVLGFLGPNGAGKSTTMKMVTGFLRPTAGRAAICGQDVLDHPIAAKRHLGYLPEGAPLYPDMTPRGFLNFVAAARGLRGADRRGRVDRAIAMTQLESVLAQPIDTLSKGFKRRVGLAQALLHDPDVLILDEPTDGLDPNQKHEVRKLIHEISPTKAIVISTHILEEVEAVCSRAVVIAQGKVIADDTPAGLVARSPRHGAVSLTLPAGQTEAIKTALSHIPGIGAVEQGKRNGAGVSLTVFPAPGTDIATAIAERAAAEHWPISNLQTERGNLDEVFRRLTQPQAREAA
ncbi:MAG: ABC transporter ATP-binding protein [Alphaproteobacteria bacterium]|nr:ABC transporter ATP-binding protein [Alphaproteobacteria bacterium]MCB9931129.1 ABC transporter ATP-binding protein [Alphaproteobacteria bacterium]